MKKIFKAVLIIIMIIGILWGLLTLFVEMKGSKQQSQFGDTTAISKALIVYNGDPFYNLDEQVCQSFARGLVVYGWNVQVMTVAAANEINVSGFGLYVFCANTYNWSPDWPITRFIKHHVLIKGKNIAAITLGAGSTKRSMRILEDLIQKEGGNLIESETYWLWRPNDESRAKESNVKVAVDMAEKYGEAVAEKIATTPK